MLQSIMFRLPMGKFGIWEMECVSSIQSVYHIRWMFQSIMIMIYVVQEIFDILCAMLTLCFPCTVGRSRARVHPWRRVSRSRMDSSLWCALLWISVPVQDNVPLCQWYEFQISARLTRVIYVYTLDCQTQLWPGGHRLRWGECDTQGVYKINFSY